MVHTWFKKLLLRDCSGENYQPASVDKIGIAPLLPKKETDKVEVAIGRGWARFGFAMEDISMGDSLEIDFSTGRTRRARK